MPIPTRTLSTRNDAFFAHRDSGCLGEQERAVMKVLHASGNEGKDFTLNELGAILGLPASTISARVNQLKKLGYLEESTPRFHRLPGNWRTRVTPVRLPAIQRTLFGDDTVSNAYGVGGNRNTPRQLVGETLK